MGRAVVVYAIWDKPQSVVIGHLVAVALGGKTIFVNRPVEHFFRFQNVMPPGTVILGTRIHRVVNGMFTAMP